MKEVFLAYLWGNRLYRHDIVTADGQPIEVIFPGTTNTHAGPDFLQARIRIGDTLWAGNVEIHVNSSDWYAHGHQNDKNYENVILHVVYNADKIVYTPNGMPIATLALKGRFDESLLLRYRKFIDSRQWIACEQQVSDVQRFTWLSWLDRLIADRLELKTEEVMADYHRYGNDWEAVFFHRLLLNFGFQVNEEGFRQLAHKLSFQLLLKHAGRPDQLEALLLGTAGFLAAEMSDEYAVSLKREWGFLKHKYKLGEMEVSQWRFLRMRPSNFPAVRLAQLAALVHKNERMFSKIIETPSVEEIKQFFETQASAYWDWHFQPGRPSASVSPKRLGVMAQRLILINTVAQILFAYGHFYGRQDVKDKALMLLESVDAEDNAVLRKFNSLGLKAYNALQSQALLHMKKHFCDPKRCLECRIGKILIKSDARLLV